MMVSMFEQGENVAITRRLLVSSMQLLAVRVWPTGAGSKFTPFMHMHLWMTTIANEDASLKQRLTAVLKKKPSHLSIESWSRSNNKSRQNFCISHKIHAMHNTMVTVGGILFLTYAVAASMINRHIRTCAARIFNRGFHTVARIFATTPTCHAL